jgi:hypothetical protein
MATCQTRNLTISLLVALLPMNVALAGGRGGGPQGAVGYGLSGSSGYGAAVGGGAPAGAVGGGPPAGLIGGGIAPTNTNHTRSSGGGLGPGVGSEVGVPGAYTGIPSAPDTPAGGLAPSNPSNPGSAETGRSQSPESPKSGEGVAAAPDAGSTKSPLSPKSVEGVAPAQDAVSTQMVAPRPCGVAAHETDGFTTCIGILPSGHARSGRARRHTGDMRRPAHMARS